MLLSAKEKYLLGTYQPEIGISSILLPNKYNEEGAGFIWRDQVNRQYGNNHRWGIGIDRWGW
ncbi:MAG: hypothetical protein ACXVAY_06950 [Mucilaginibacter sp.]